MSICKRYSRYNQKKYCKDSACIVCGSRKVYIAIGKGHIVCDDCKGESTFKVSFNFDKWVF